MLVENPTSRCFIFRKDCSIAALNQDFQILELILYLVHLHEVYWQKIKNLKKYITLECFGSMEAQCFSVIPISVACLQDKKSSVGITPHISSPFNILLFGVAKLKLSFEPMPTSVHV